MGQIFTAYMGGTQEGIAVGPIALLWNLDATKVIRVRRVLSFAASPQYREWIGSMSSPVELMVYPSNFSATGYYERPVVAHDQAAPPLGDVIVASGQGAGTGSVASVLVSGAGQTIRRGFYNRANPSWTHYYSYTFAALCNLPYFGEMYRAPADVTVQPITLRRGEAIVMWCTSVAATYLIPANVVIEFEQVDA